MGAALGAEFTRNGVLEIAAGECFGRALGVAESLRRHQHEKIGTAAGDILALAAMALCLEHRVALGDVTQFSAIASALQFHDLFLSVQCMVVPDAAWACSSIASIICGHIAIGKAWPMRSIMTSLAPGTDAAVSLPPAGGTSGSTVP